MRRLLTIIFVLIFSVCSCKQATRKQPIVKDVISYQETQLKQTIDTLLKEFAKHGHGKNAILIEGQSAAFNTDSLSLRLKHLRDYDVFDVNAFELHKQNCNGIEILTWKAKENFVDTIRLVKYVYQSKYTEDGSNNDIKITDFELFTVNGENAFKLRVANDFEFEQLSVGAIDYKLNYYEKIINHVVYKPVFEDRLLGLDEIEREYDGKRKACR
ncbi:MAG: hypothetical protein JWR72_4224 [Flavisolibacter sp.]|nr:hypothetical protein [Flavisolibacter sp.]